LRANRVGLFIPEKRGATLSRKVGIYSPTLPFVPEDLILDSKVGVDGCKRAETTKDVSAILTVHGDSERSSFCTRAEDLLFG